jgi:hypothetical protein
MARSGSINGLFEGLVAPEAIKAAIIGLFSPIPNLVAGGSDELSGMLAGRREFTGWLLAQRGD